MQFFVSSIVLCVCCFQLIEVLLSNDLENEYLKKTLIILFQINESDDFFKLAFCLGYSFIMFLEILVPSYFGSFVSSKGEEIPYALFQSNWIFMDASIKKMIRIFMLRTMTPIQICTAKVFFLNLGTLMQVLWKFENRFKSKINYNLFTIQFFSDSKNNIYTSCHGKKYGKLNSNCGFLKREQLFSYFIMMKLNYNGGKIIKEFGNKN